jgi:hypothetical protein
VDHDKWAQEVEKLKTKGSSAELKLSEAEAKMKVSQELYEKENEVTGTNRHILHPL